jgi:hypothetical protein
MSSASDSRPVPDPTVLTTQQLQREVTMLRELIYVRLDAMDKAMVVFSENITRVPTDVDKQVGQLRALHDEKFLSLDQSLAERERLSLSRYQGIEQQFEERDARFSQYSLDRKAAVDSALAAAESLHTEKFASIEKQFRERDVRVEGTAVATKTAVDAALMAAEKAVLRQQEAFSLSIGKSETNFVKAIDQQGLLISSSTSALDSKISDLKDRLTRIEGKEVGTVVAQNNQTSQMSVWSAVIFGVIGTLVAIGSLVFTLVKTQ